MYKMYKINTKPNQKRDKFTNTTLENDNFILNNNNNNNNNYNNYNNNNNNIINEDINKMHLLPPHCPMTPTSYTDYFSDNTTLSRVEPYKTELVKHPKDGYTHKIEYNHFYNDLLVLELLVLGYLLSMHIGNLNPLVLH